MKHIIRSGYVMSRGAKKITVKATAGRKSYTYMRKPGFTRVKPVPAYDVGAIGKGPKLIGKLKKGMLTSYGYHPVEAKTNRHKSLSKAISKGKEVPLTVFRRLQAIGTLTKRTLPRASRIYRADAKWIRAKYASKFKTSLTK
jgi:hypothetical protein